MLRLNSDKRRLHGIPALCRTTHGPSPHLVVIEEAEAHGRHLGGRGLLAVQRRLHGVPAARCLPEPKRGRGPAGRGGGRERSAGSGGDGGSTWQQAGPRPAAPRCYHRFLCTAACCGSRGGAGSAMQLWCTPASAYGRPLTAPLLAAPRQLQQYAQLPRRHCRSPHACAACCAWWSWEGSPGAWQRTIAAPPSHP